MSACGGGDVSLLAAAIVGPAGSVLGVDRAAPPRRDRPRARGIRDRNDDDLPAERVVERLADLAPRGLVGSPDKGGGLCRGHDRIPILTSSGRRIGRRDGLPEVPGGPAV